MRMFDHIYMYAYEHMYGYTTHYAYDSEQGYVVIVYEFRIRIHAYDYVSNMHRFKHMALGAIAHVTTYAIKRMLIHVVMRISVK